MHVTGQNDADLHYPNGEHRGTPATTDGHALALYEARIRAHLDAHKAGGATDGR